MADREAVASRLTEESNSGAWRGQFSLMVAGPEGGRFPAPELFE